MPKRMPPRSITRWRRTTPSLGQLLQAGQRWVAASKIGIRCDHRRDVTRLGGHRDGLGRAIRPEVEIMVAEGGGVAAHPGQQLQLAAGLADGGGERGPHAVVTGIEHQHRTLPCARRFLLRDQGGQAREPAPGLVVVERERGVVRGRRHPDQIGVEVVGVQDGEGLLPVRCPGSLSAAGRPSRRSPPSQPRLRDAKVLCSTGQSSFRSRRWLALRLQDVS